MNLTSVQSLQIAALTGLFLLTSIGCVSGTSSGTRSVTTQPTQPTQPVTPVVPVVPAGWTNLDTHWFSFSYPTGWQLNDQTSTNPPFANASESGFAHQFVVEFQPGVINQAGILDQCAGARQALLAFYNANILPLEKNVGRYPNTTTTYDSNVGFLSGVEFQISVVSTPANSGPNFNLWLNAIQYADGLYLVGYEYPGGDDYYTWVPARKKFTDTIFFKSTAISSTAPCNYKG